MSTRPASGEQHCVTALDDLAPECDRRMRLADARRTEQQEHITAGDPAPGGKFADLLELKRLGLHLALDDLAQVFKA